VPHSLPGGFIVGVGDSSKGRFLIEEFLIERVKLGELEFLRHPWRKPAQASEGTKPEYGQTWSVIENQTSKPRPWGRHLHSIAAKWS